MVILADINKVKENPNNPRTIKGEKFKKLVKSIKDFPDMLNKRPIVTFTDEDGNYVALGGNMRLKALKELKYEKVPIIIADDWTQEQKDEFLIKDNVGFGEWDWDVLANEWDVDKLDDWGLDLPIVKTDEEIYTTKIESPIYSPSEIKPEIKDLYDLKKYNELINEIDENKNINEDEKEFLKICAKRHIVFDYRKIADFYAHSNKDVQELMENSALVIIDFKKAVEKGFVELYNNLEKLLENE